MEPLLQRIQIVFFGRVQNVGFRAAAATVAGNYAVTGWVKNQADRTVLMEVQGVPVQVQMMLDGLRARMGANIREERAMATEVVASEVGFSITG